MPSEDSNADYNEDWAPIDSNLSSKGDRNDLENKKAMDGWENDDGWNEEEDFDKVITASSNINLENKSESNEDNWLDAQLRPSSRADSHRSSLSSSSNIQQNDPIKSETEDTTEKRPPRRVRAVVERKPKTKKGPMRLGAQKIT